MTSVHGLSALIPNDKNMELRQMVDAEIDSTKKSIQTLQNRLFDLYEAWNSTSVIQSVLTDDILAEIFLFASQDHGSMPFVLGSVCRAWRKLAWQTPRLWQCLFVTFSHQNEDIQEKVVEDWIARSGSLPLELHISFQDGHIPSLEHVRPLLAASPRWKTLHIGPGTFESLRHECARLECEFPLLCSVHLEEDTMAEGPPWNFLSSPISDLTITGNNGIWNLFRWDNLQTFVGHKFDVAHCLSALKAIASESSRCQSCTLSLIGSGDIASNTDDEPFVLSQLQNLHIEVDASVAPQLDPEDIDLSRLFESIEAPALTTLEMALACVDVVFASHIVNMVKQSNCPLSELVIDLPNITEDDLLVTLRQLPSLSSLSYTSFFQHFIFTDETMIFLNPELPSHHSANCLPNLTQFKYAGPIDFEPQYMIDMLKSRIHHAESKVAAYPPLKKLLSFKIGYCNKDWAQDQDPNKIRDFHQAVTVLRAQGPDIEISWGKQYEHR